VSDRASGGTVVDQALLAQRDRRPRATYVKPTLMRRFFSFSFFVIACIRAPLSVTLLLHLQILRGIDAGRCCGVGRRRRLLRVERKRNQS
jgi:hypothetical protein